MQLNDSAERYGAVSRGLHWGMAVLLLIQFASAAAHFLAEDTALEALLWPAHKPVGFLLMLLIVVRLLWAVINSGRRPPSLNGFAKAGHLVLYGLLLVIPAVALLRQYGSGKAFEPFGIPLMPGFPGDKIEWMMAPANLHGEFGWLLLALIIGHAYMAFAHRSKPGEVNVLPRMWG